MDILSIEPKIVDSRVAFNDGMRADLEFDVEYFNYTGRVVTISTRSGMKFKIANVARFGYSGFVVRTTYRIRNEVKNNCIDILNALENKSKQLALFSQAFSTEVTITNSQTINAGWTSVDVCFEYTIALSDIIKSQGKAIYNRETDIVICCGEEDDCPDHPYSTQHIVNGKALNVELENNNGVSYAQYLLVDNEKELGNRFVNLNGDILCIRSICNPEFSSGVYITTSHKLNSDPEGTGKILSLETKYIPPSLFSSSGIYATSEDASTLGDGNARLKESLLKREHEIIMLKKVIEEEKISLDKRTRELDTQAKEFEHIRSLERSRISDMYEDRAYIRKDSSESFKMIPIIIGAITALAGIIVGLFSRKS